MNRVVGAYVAAVRLYPRAFRREYGGDLVLLAEDLVVDLGPRRAAARLARDLLVSLPARYLEVLVRRPAPILLPTLAALTAATLIVTAVVLGTGAGIGLLVLAMLAATVAALAFPGARVLRERSVSSHWWQLLLVGVLLNLGVSAGQVLFDNDGWYVWPLAFGAVIGGWMCIATGMVLAVLHFVRRRPATI